MIYTVSFKTIQSKMATFLRWQPPLPATFEGLPYPTPCYPIFLFIKMTAKDVL